MRYYVGVDWAEQTHAVWVVDERGTKVSGDTVPHTAEGLSEWGRELEQWRAQGIELWAAIERPDGHVVDFLLDHDVVVYPVNPKALDRARDRFRQSGAKRATRLTLACWPIFSALITLACALCTRARTRPGS